MARLFVNIAAVLSLLSLITVAAGAGSTTTTTASSSSSSSSLSADEQCFCALTGQIDDCCCSIEDVERLNAHIQPLALRLAQSAFFKFYRVNMDRPCRFWRYETAGCGTSHCSVVPCSEDEVPPALRTLEEVPYECRPKEASPLGILKDTVTEEQIETLEALQEFDIRNSDYCDTDDYGGETLKYVNLLDNPERFTGYTGGSPAQIWRAIYNENCFRPEDENVKFLTANVVNNMCMEKRVFYRVVSGLHATINIHVAAHYPKPGVLGDNAWGPNITLFERFFHPAKTFGEGPHWLRNVYFTYLMLVRAVSKAAPMWDPVRFHTGDVEEDNEVSGMVNELITAAPRTCPSTFDETQMFNDPGSEQLKAEFKSHFRNISRIMDCVECSTCKLWGKLKVHGLATAMKILFSETNADNIPLVRIKRNDVVALFNTLAQFAEALEDVNRFKKLLTEGDDSSAANAAQIFSI